MILGVDALRTLITTEPRLRIIDATLFSPGNKREAGREFIEGRIPGSIRFDLDHIADTDAPLPHTVPDSERFAVQVGRLGIGAGDFVVAYDRLGVYSAPRAWWLFRLFGHDRVAVLDGGFPRWVAEDCEIERGEPAPRVSSLFVATAGRPDTCRTLPQMLDAVLRREELVVDMRSTGRFAATEKEPNPRLRSGHIPGSANLPFEWLIAPDGRLRPPAELSVAFTQAAIGSADRLIATCGGGTTACILALAAHELGWPDVAVYDGSWSEWAGRSDTPIHTGPPAPRASA